LQSETAGTLHATAGPEGDAPLVLLPGTAHAGDARTVRWDPGVPSETDAEVATSKTKLTALIDFEVDETLGSADAPGEEATAVEDVFAEDPFADDLPADD